MAASRLFMRFSSALKRSCEISINITRGLVKSAHYGYPGEHFPSGQNRLSFRLINSVLQQKQFLPIIERTCSYSLLAGPNPSQPSVLLPICAAPVQLQQRRNVIKFSLTSGKRKSVEAVLKRFYRLQSGLWIRPMIGKHKKLWKKGSQQRRLLRQHVFCSEEMCEMLDKMVTPYWKKPKFFIDDPYEPYQERHGIVYYKRHWSKYPSAKIPSSSTYIKRT